MRLNLRCGVTVQLEIEGVLRRVYGGAMAPRESNGRDLTREQGLD